MIVLDKFMLAFKSNQKYTFNVEIFHFAKVRKFYCSFRIKGSLSSLKLNVRGNICNADVT